MSPLKYMKDVVQVANTSEILRMKREHPKDWDRLIEMAKEEMQHNGIAVDGDVNGQVPAQAAA